MVDKHAKGLLSATKNRVIALENVAIRCSKCIKSSKTKKKKARIAINSSLDTSQDNKEHVAEVKLLLQILHLQV